MSYYGSTCSGKNKRTCLCQANVSCLERVEGDGFHSKGKHTCQCVEEAAWNKTIPPKPNCEWLSSFKELRRQWSNHSRQQSCRCYSCSSYRCQSCLTPLSSYSGADALSAKACQECGSSAWSSDSRSKDKSNYGCALSNYSTPVRNFQNPRIYRPLDGQRSCSPARRPTLIRRGLCSQCIPECCFCQSATKSCNCAASVRENSRDERDCCSECPSPSRERTFPRNKSESTDKLNCSRCQFQGAKCQCCKCESPPPCGQCTCRRSKVNSVKTNCCMEDSDTCSSRSKPASRPKSARHKATDTFYEETHVLESRLGDDTTSGALTEIIKDDTCCCCNLKIGKNRKEFIEQCNIKQNSFLPKNCFQCPICSSVLSSNVWKCSTIMSPKLYNFKMENNVKFNCKQSKINDSLQADNSNFDLNSSISFVESCKMDAISEQVTEKCNETVFHKQYKSEEKITFRNPALNIGNCVALMNSNCNKIENVGSCVKECKRYKKKKKRINCKFKLDQKEDIPKPNTHLASNANNDQIPSPTRQNLDQNSERKETINGQDNSSESWNDDNLNESSSEECVIHSR